MISPKLTLKNTFADSLKKPRTDNHLSQQQLADKLFVNRSTIANWELGRRVPDATIIVRIAKIFGVDVSDLLDILLITQFTTVIYYITPDNVYKRGDYYFVLLVPAVMVMIVNLIGLLIKRRSVKREEFFAFLAYIIAPTVSMIIQLMFYGVTVIVLGTAIAALFLVAVIRRYQTKQYILQQEKIAEQLKTLIIYRKKGKRNATKKENEMPQKRKMNFVSN